MSPKQRLIMGYIGSAGLLVLVISLFGIQSALKQYNELRWLSHDGKEGTAVVTSKECHNHGRIGWELRLPEKTIHGISNGCGPAFNCESVAVGDSLVVRYIDAKPSVSDCGSVSDKANEMLLMICIMIGACGLICIHAAFKCRKALADA